MLGRLERQGDGAEPQGCEVHRRCIVKRVCAAVGVQGEVEWRQHHLYWEV